MRKYYFLIFFLLNAVFVMAQTQLVFVFFRDKPNSADFFQNPLSELSQKSLDRRAAQGIELNEQDAPLEDTYVQAVKDLGFTVTDTSKWLNGVAVNADEQQIAQLKNLSFVASVESFAKNAITTTEKRKTGKNKFDSESHNFDYGYSEEQIEQINLRALHVMGYTGTGITIAVLDTGFPNVDKGSSYKRLRDNGQIKGGYNFVQKNSDIYNPALNTHGANCLGIMGGYVENAFTGSAPDADYYLYATENAEHEIPEEELYWIEAAEEADRVGADVISSSLGYGFDFDDPRYDYQYEDMTGSRSFIARGAQAAVEKGIIVSAAAGNEGNNNWHYILSPADNTKVFTVGGVDSSGDASVFSSYGPNASGAPKPDGSARGTFTAYTTANGISAGNGTSYATPLVSGGFACLLQVVGKTANREAIMSKVRETASLYPSHDDQLGYGILNFYEAYKNLILKTQNSTAAHVDIFPNPAHSGFRITTPDKILKVEIFDATGKQTHCFARQEKYSISELPAGIYFIKITTSTGVTVKKLIKN